MKGCIEFTVRLIRAGKRTYTRKWSFLGFFVVFFFGSVVVLGKLDLLPEIPPVQTTSAIALTQQLVVAEVSELPTKIEISKLNLSATVVNPTKTDIASLDKELLKGAVRYPTSARLGETGNVVLFGHSSYLPIVGNPAYKTFNGIQKLVAGEIVTVYSSGTAYTYRVRSVVKENATNAKVPFSVSGRVLTLITCNSFGAKEDRFIVTADFVESHSLST